MCSPWSRASTWAFWRPKAVNSFRIRPRTSHIANSSNIPSRKMSTPATTPWIPNRYPETRRSDHVDTWKSESRGEVKIHDPYQWLEESNDETDRWVDAQVKFTRAYLDQNPDRLKLEEAIRRATDYAKFSAPIFRDDGRWYWSYNSGLQAQPVIYRSKDGQLPDFSKDSEATIGEIFFDPNLLSEDGTSSLATAAHAKSGKYYAYGVSEGGSDFVTVYVRPTDEPLAPAANGTKPSHHDKRLPDEIKFVKFSSLSWTHDSKGFFYMRYPETKNKDGDGGPIRTGGDINAMLYYHKIGTAQSDDILIIKDEDHPTYMWSAGISEVDGKYLELSISRDTSRKNLLWIADIENKGIGPDLKWIKVINDFEASYSVVSNDGTKFFVHTNKDASQYKLVSVDIADEKPTFVDVIPEDKEAHLEDVVAIGDNLAVIYKRHVKDEIYVYSKDGTRLDRLAPDFVGTATLSGRRKYPWFFVTMTGFTNPGVVAKYDFEGQKGWQIFRTTVVQGLKPEDFSAEQVWYEGKDGVAVPIFIVKHKDTKFDGTAPAIQFGYGGFSISINPFFSPAMLTVMQKYGAILAVPNIRGGGEFGEEWHLAGTRERKINVFNDFIAATQFLVKNKYAAPGKVAINGGSNGGLLVAACVNIAPEGTFGAGVADVGVMDLLKFADFTIGRAWTSDYGDPHDPHDFDFIFPISPVHNVPSDRVLPPVIISTADHDDRVVPMHSFKLAATLQHTLPHNPHPLLIRIDKKAGHGAGKSTDARIKEAADKWGFVAQSLGLKWRDE